MGSHEEFRELCAAATAGELSADEQSKLAAHLSVCPDCRRVKSEYEAAAVAGAAALAESHGREADEGADSSWSVEEAEERFFKRLSKEEGSVSAELRPAKASAGKRHTSAIEHGGDAEVMLGAYIASMTASQHAWGKKPAVHLFCAKNSLDS